MKYEWSISNLSLNCFKYLELKSFPIIRILTMDVTDTTCKHINTKIVDHLTLCWISALTLTDYAIFFSAVILIVTVSSMLIAVHPAIKSVGFSTLIGLLSAVILSYVVQPAVFRKLKK